MKKMNEHIITNHIYIQDEDNEIGFILNSNKHFVDIETENKEGESFSITLRLIEFLTIAETLKKAAGYGVMNT